MFSHFFDGVAVDPRDRAGPAIAGLHGRGQSPRRDARPSLDRPPSFGSLGLPGRQEAGAPSRGSALPRVRPWRGLELLESHGPRQPLCRPSSAQLLAPAPGAKADGGVRSRFSRHILSVEGQNARFGSAEAVRTAHCSRTAVDPHPNAPRASAAARSLERRRASATAPSGRGVGRRPGARPGSCGCPRRVCRAARPP